VPPELQQHQTRAFQQYSFVAVETMVKRNDSYLASQTNRIALAYDESKREGKRRKEAERKKEEEAAERKKREEKAKAAKIKRNLYGEKPPPTPPPPPEPVYEVGLGRMIEALIVTKTLRTLDLSGNRMGPVLFGQLCESLSLNQTLRWFGVAGNCLGMRHHF
jgi:hypothetical protein